MVVSLVWRSLLLPLSLSLSLSLSPFPASYFVAFLHILTNLQQAKRGINNAAVWRHWHALRSRVRLFLCLCVHRTNEKSSLFAKITRKRLTCLESQVEVSLSSTPNITILPFLDAFPSFFFCFPSFLSYPWAHVFFLHSYVGTPPQRVSVIIDTGSHHTAFPCAGCSNCGKHTDPYYEPTKSSTNKVSLGRLPVVCVLRPFG